jgi:hypothetical protein
MRYVISTIQYCASVNKPLLKNILAFADKHRVDKILLYVMSGKYKDEETISPCIMEDDRIELLFLNETGMKLNSNLRLHDTKILASQINPLTGFQKKLNRDCSFILPSPKIRYLSIPNTSSKPRFLATTGALTHGNYKDHTAQGRKAILEHEYGFAYVKIRNNRLFDYHPVMAQKNGNFNYMREHYRGGKCTDQQPEALVLGDWHTGDTCPKVRKRSIKMIEQLHPKRVVFHDLFNGHSINHHEQQNNLSKARLWQEKMHVLEEEVTECLNELAFFADKFPDIEFLVAESNHDLFLSKYIGTENFLEDGQNSVFSCKLFIAATQAEQPILQSAMELVGDIPENVRFLAEDEEYRVRGIGLDYHGHRGLNGSRGSSSSFDRFNLKLITAHEHTPKIYANGMVVGTSTYLRLGYTKGAGSWLNAHGILYNSGKYSLLTIII